MYSQEVRNTNKVRGTVREGLLSQEMDTASHTCPLSCMPFAHLGSHGEKQPGWSQMGADSCRRKEQIKWVRAVLLIEDKGSKGQAWKTTGRIQTGNSHIKLETGHPTKQAAGSNKWRVQTSSHGNPWKQMCKWHLTKWKMGGFRRNRNREITKWSQKELQASRGTSLSAKCERKHFMY